MQGGKNNNEEALLEIINNVPHYIFWKDKNLIFRGCNKMFAKQFGYKDQSGIIGKTDEDFPWSKELRKKYRQDDLSVIETGKPKLDYEESQVQADGSIKTVLVSKVPYRNKEGNIVGILGIYTDITKRKRMEESLRKANKVKSEFLANMGHDLRTPLTGIILIAEYLWKKQTEEKDKQLSKDLILAGKQLLHFINEVLEITNVEAGNIDYEKKSFSLKKLIDQVFAMLRPSFQQKQLAFYNDYDPHIPEVLIGSEIMIFRILMNLLGNSLKFTEEGQVTIQTKLANRSGNQVLIELIVSDTGIGIPKEEHKNIFAKFKRLIPSYASKYRGSGLGLFLVKTYAEALQGQVTLESEPGRGSRFICTIPLTVGKRKDLRSQKEKSYDAALTKLEELLEPELLPSIAKKSDLKKVPVLLVEDIPLAQKAIGIKLEELGCAVDLADNGEAAIKKASQNRYSLIFMDIGLPGIDGYEAAARIRAWEKEHHKSPTPIVALTAHVNEEGEQQCYKVGMNLVLHKPMLGQYGQRILNRFVNNERREIGSPASDAEKRNNNNKVIDWTSATRIFGNKAAAEKMFKLFLEELPRFHEDIKKAFEANDRKALAFLVHKLNGAACYAPTPRLQKILVDFESKLRSRSPIDLKPYYDKLEKELQAVLATANS